MPRPQASTWRWWVAVVCLFASTAGLRAAVDPSRFRERDYLSVVALGRQCGLTSKWDPQRKVLTLAGPNGRIEFESDSREVWINGLRVFLCEPMTLHRKVFFISKIDGERFLLPIFNPPRIAGRPPALHTIVLDPGHGGKDDGARNARSGLLEKSAALDVAKRVGAQLTAAGYHVVFTRATDTFIPLPDRPAIATREKADLFVSIHFNAIENPAISGNETYILTPQNQRSTGSEKPGDDDAVLLPGNGADEWNAVLGYRMHLHVAKVIQGTDRGLKRARYAVLRDLRCPGVLVEGGYITNEAEARKIATPEWREQLATAIVAGIASYHEALNAAGKK